MGFRMDPGSALSVGKIKAIDRDFVRGVRQAWFKTGRILLTQVQKDILHKPKSGRVYRLRKGKRLVTHTASAPGETPANFTGVYRKSMGFQIQGWRRMEFGSRSGSAPYAKYLETGTSRMKARPGIGNALSSQENRVRSEIDNAIRGALTT